MVLTHRLRQRRTRDERGAVALMVGAMTVMLFLIAALVVDLGLARDTKRQSQNSADAAALAAGNALYPEDGTCETPTSVPSEACLDDAVERAQTYAEVNFGVTSWTGCSAAPAGYYVLSGSPACISFDEQAAPTKVRVVMPTRDVDTALGGLTGVQNIPISTNARATLEPPGLPCIVCVLGSGQTHDIQNGDVIVDGGNVHFNGNVAVGTQGLVVTDGDITVEGTASGSYANYTPDPATGVDPIADPLSYLVLPPDMSALSATPKTNPCTQGPGRYGAYNFPNSTCTLQPGLYVIAGGSSTEWDQTGNASSILAGAGVTLYFTCGSPSTPTPCAVGQQGATLDAAGNGSITLSPPLSGPLQGVTIAYDRNNASTMRLTGNGIAGMTGAIYMQHGELQMNGNGCTQTNSAIVVGSIEMNGNPACLKVGADPSNNPVPPPGGLHLDQ